MADRTFDNLDPVQLPLPQDSHVPDVRDLPDDFWERHITNIKVDWDRVGRTDWEALSG